MKPSPIVRLSNINVVRRERITLEDINLTINRGDFMAVTGPNGGGKTTMLRVILRLMKPTTGSVQYLSPDGLQVKDLRIGYLPQKNTIDSRFPITVHDLIESGLMGLVNISRDERKNRTASMISEIGLQSHTDAVIGTLSGGQMQRALLGRALIGNPELLVLDEPLSYVDKHFEQRIYDIMARVSHDTTIILVSHEMSTISGMANRHIVVDSILTQCTANNHQVHYDCNC